MDNTKSVEKSHEQVKLRSLTRNAEKGNSTKQKLSFTDNRPVTQRQRDMMGIMQRAVNLSVTYKAAIPGAQAAFQALDNSLRNLALPNAQQEFTQKFNKNIEHKPEFIRDVETNNQSNIYMSWGKFIENHFHRDIQ